MRRLFGALPSVGIAGAERFVFAAGAAAVLIAVSGASVAAYNHPSLKIAKVEIAGATSLDPASLIRTAGISGRHILEVRDDEVAASLAGIPRVRGVEVERRMPDTVVLHILEREPWAVWQATDGAFLIDQDGIVIDRAGPASKLLSVAFKGRSGLKPGAAAPADIVRTAFAIDHALPEAAGVRAKQFEYAENGGLLVITTGGWQARFGGPEDTEYKLAALRAIVGRARERGTPFTAVDLRFGPRPFIR